MNDIWNNPELIRIINIIRKNDVVKSLYKLIVLVQIGVNKTTTIKLILGGNYYMLIQQAETRGLLIKKPGGFLELTDEGKRIADIIYRCVVEIENREIEKKSET